MPQQDFERSHVARAETADAQYLVLGPSLSCESDCVAGLDQLGRGLTGPTALDWPKGLGGQLVTPFVVTPPTPPRVTWGCAGRRDHLSRHAKD